MRKKSPWLWVPSLYYAEGIPYIVVMAVSVVMYKKLGISNTEIALYTAWLYLPWVIKPLWSPIVELFRTKRFWITTMQFLIGAVMASVALSIPVPGFFRITLMFLWLLAFSSATHDIAADGFYMLGLSQHQQALFVGVRSTFYRFAMITGQGLLVILAGFIESHSGLATTTIPVIAVHQTHVQQFVHPDSLDITPLDGPLRIMTFHDTVQIAITPQSQTALSARLAQVREWNQSGLQPTEKKQIIKEEDLSWWQRHVSKPLETWLKDRFNAPETPSAGQNVGNIGLVYFHLSKAPEPGKTIVINFGRSSGDKSIALVSGTRMVFNENNWNRPAVAILQLDPKLKSPTQAKFDARAGNIPLSWILTFFFMAVMFLIFFIYHRIALPKTAEDQPRQYNGFMNFIRDFWHTFSLFFKKENIGVSIAFLLLFRLGEAQLVKLAIPFMLDSQEAGGLSLTTGQVGFVYGTIGMLMLTIGGLLGGFVAAKFGLKKWIWWMAIAINIPDAVYIYMSQVQPDNFFIINICVGIEQFGYGFGFTAYMLYMIYISQGEFKTSHFAITTGFMALGMMLPGMISGWIQEIVGYPSFFIWVLIATVPGFLILKFLPLDKDFGKK